MTLHNGALRRTTQYNNRLQPSELSAEDLSPLTTLMSFSYGFNLGTANNGNPVAVTDAIQNLSYNYTYDELNRLLTAQTASNLWGNSYVYDIWGNLTNMNPIAGKTYYQNLQAAPASTKNQLPSFSYDAAGNMTADGVHTYAWDAENRMQSVDAGAATYAYTPDGERVKKTVSGTATWFRAAWSQTFSCDAFGNISKSGSSSFQPTYNTATNRISQLPGFTPTYDANGNLQNDSIRMYIWDAEGRPVTIGTVTLTYDALGRMVQQQSGSSYTQIVYSRWVKSWR
jgi:hypothetical protein